MQRIINRSATPIEAAIKYYSILSSINSLGLTDRQIALLAFIAVKGSISSSAAKNSFMEMYGSPKASIGNMVWALSKKGILVREDGKIVITPQLALDFNSTIVLNLILSNG